MARQGDLKLVVRLLVVFPSILAVTLVTSHPLVLTLHFLGEGGLPGVLLVLEHTTHTKDGLFLVGVILLLLDIVVLLLDVLTVLLGSPFLLVLSVENHSIVVHCTIQTKLDTW